MKGDRNRRKHGFQTGHIAFPARQDAQNSCQSPPNSAWQPRLTQEMYKLVVREHTDGTLFIPDADGRDGPAKILRPRPAKPSVCDQYLQEKNKKASDDEMRLLHGQLTMDMYNTVIKEHAQESPPSCSNLQIEQGDERQKGLCWGQQLSCRNCKYVSKMFKLYKETKTGKRGPNYASPNLGLQVALQDTTIGCAKARLLIAATNTPPPCESAMRRTANLVGAKTVALNQDDMAARLDQLRSVNEARGLDRDTAINVQMDVRYDSQTIGCRHKLGQAATQAIRTMCEDVTDQHQIIGLYMQNKLCWTGAWLRGEGFDVRCPGGHPDCTANLATHTPLSERDIGAALGQSLAVRKVLVKHVTTDGDGRGSQGIDEAMKLLDPLWETQRQADTTHVGQGQFRAGVRASFSKGMFPGRTTQEQRKEAQRMLATDIKNRSHLIMKELFATNRGELALIKKQLAKVVDATLRCYEGDCSGCRRVCNMCGAGKRTSWWMRSHNLKQANIDQLVMTSTDKRLVQEILMMKLSVEAVETMKLQNTTNRCEAINRGISASLSKNVNHPRNAFARASSAIHRLNHGVGQSTILKLEHVGAPLSKGGRVAKAVAGMQRAVLYARKYRTLKSVRMRRARNKSRQMKEFMAAKQERKQSQKQEKADYRKGQLDVRPKVPRPRVTRARTVKPAKKSKNAVNVD